MKIFTALGGDLVKKIAKALVVVGIVLILIPIIGRCYTYYRQKQLYEAYLEKNFEYALGQASEKDEIAHQEPNDETKNLETAQQKEEKIKYEDLLINQGEVIGKIIIGKIDLNLILLEGETEDEMRWGAGHMLKTAWPGETGNCVIAGHRNYTFGSMFNRLDEIEVGDEVKLEFLGETFKYKINEKIIVEPNDLSVLEQDKTKKELTLITCHPIYTGTHRLIIKGNLEES